MIAWVLNDKTAETPIGDVLDFANGSDLDIRDEHGQLLARIVLHREPPTAEEQAAIERAEAEIDELRRREAADRSRDITTKELLARVAARARS
jgi:hypothetical protein